MSTLIRYTLLRLLIFAVCFGVLWLLFDATLVSYWLLALLALLFTSGLSMLLLRRQGAQAAEAMRGVVTRSRGRFENSVGASASKEDAELDEQGSMEGQAAAGQATEDGADGDHHAGDQAGGHSGERAGDHAGERVTPSSSLPGRHDS